MIRHEKPRSSRAAAAGLGAALAASLLAACATPQLAKYAIADLTPARAAALGRKLVVIPASLKIMAGQAVGANNSATVGLDAARGEAESAQLLLYSGAAAVESATLRAEPLVGPGGYAIEPELGLVGYVPVTKPSLVGFRRAGAYPDPISPADAPFAVAAARSQALWYTVKVPRDAPPGRYAGRVSVALDPVAAAALALDGAAAAASAGAGVLSVPVELTVYPVDLPVASFLATSVNFRMENEQSDSYYGANWTPEMTARLPELGLAYRFSCRVDLGWETVFRIEDGALAADWTGFDAAVARWLELGITAFEVKLPIDWSLSPLDIDRLWGDKLAAINDHLLVRAWADRFYFYFYDEPAGRDMAAMADRLRAIRSRAPAIGNVLTYGNTKAGQTKLAGLVGVWVPNLHQYDPEFAAARRYLGDKTWAYACVANIFFRYPDNYRIDSWGTGHRALGWWLYRNGAEGFLYWAVDLWRRNPWENAATFPNTNGDGMLFYPAPDKRSMPYPSTRVHLMRDGFEDYDLLTMLRLKAEAAGWYPDEAKAILAMDELFPESGRYAADDELYLSYHRRLLALLAADWGNGAPSP
jgi:hypothetical protein